MKNVPVNHKTNEVVVSTEIVYPNTSVKITDQSGLKTDYLHTTLFQYFNGNIRKY